MAQKRMFSKKITHTDAFVNMPLSSRLLYYELNMEADDDGFVDSPIRIMRMIGCSQDDMNVLLGKNFVLPFESGVCVIKHWMIHNTIRKDRYTPTNYIDEKSQLSVKENNVYTLGNQMATNGRHSIGLGLEEVRLDLDKNRIVESKVNIITDYTSNTELQNTIKEFKKHRTKLKKPMTDFALTKLLNKLDKWYITDDDKIEALTNSIMNGWLSIYEPNGKSKQGLTFMDLED